MARNLADLSPDQRSSIKEFCNSVEAKVNELIVTSRSELGNLTLNMAYQLAIEDVILEYECPDCMYSILKGHQI